MSKPRFFLSLQYNHFQSCVQCSAGVCDSHRFVGKVISQSVRICSECDERKTLGRDGCARGLIMCRHSM